MMKNDEVALPIDGAKSRIVGKAKAAGHEPAVFVATRTDSGISLELWLSDVFKGTRRWHFWSAIAIRPEDDEQRIRQLEEEMLKKAWLGYAGGALA